MVAIVYVAVASLPACKSKPSSPAPAVAAKDMDAIKALAEGSLARCKEALAVRDDDAKTDVPATALTAAPELRQIDVDCFGPNHEARHLYYRRGRSDVELTCGKTTAVPGWEGPGKSHEPDSYETIDRLSGPKCTEDLLRVTAVHTWDKDNYVVARVTLYANGAAAKGLRRPGRQRAYRESGRREPLIDRGRRRVDIVINGRGVPTLWGQS